MTGYRGTFVLPWSQTLIDGLDAAPMSMLRIGATWEWQGAPLRVDGPDGILTLCGAEGEANLRQSVSRAVSRMLRLGKTNLDTMNSDEVEVQRQLTNGGFIVTNGAQVFRVMLLEHFNGSAPLVVFDGPLPPKAQELWVAEVHRSQPRDTSSPGVICFASGTSITTPLGPCQVQDLCPGDWVQTRDNGPQQVRWTGQRRFSSTRLRSFAGLAPVRIRAAAFGTGAPDHDLLVSPRHRILLRSPQAQAIYGHSEVLVAAQDLIDDRRIFRETPRSDVTYVHILLDRHDVIVANGVDCESFHPDDADPAMLDPFDRDRLAQVLGQGAFGGHARRVLTRPEAAILLHQAA